MSQLKKANSVEIVFGEVLKGYETKARRQVAAELTKLRKQNVKLKKLETAFKKEVESKVKAEKDKIEKKYKDRITTLKKREKELADTERNIKLALKRLEKEINVLDELNGLTIGQYVRSKARTTRTNYGVNELKPEVKALRVIKKLIEEEK